MHAYGTRKKGRVVETDRPSCVVFPPFYVVMDSPLWSCLLHVAIIDTSTCTRVGPPRPHREVRRRQTLTMDYESDCHSVRVVNEPCDFPRFCGNFFLIVRPPHSYHSLLWMKGNVDCITIPDPTLKKKHNHFGLKISNIRDYRFNLSTLYKCAYPLTQTR